MKKFSIFTFAFLLLTFPAPVFAQANTLEKAKIDPASPLYFLKSVREIFELQFAGNGQIKAYRQMEFATRRIREAKSLVEARQDLIEPTLIRYLFHLQELKGMINIRDEVAIEKVTGRINEQMSVLQSIYNQVSDKRARMAIRSTVNRVSLWNKELIDKLTELSKPHLTDKISKYQLQSCAFLAKEASSSALNEVEKTVLSERVQKCLILKP